MRVFVTGASGFLGSAIVKELIAHGHTVVGLARSDANVAAITAAGGEVLRGDLENLEVLRKGAAASDGVIHAGFIHDFKNFAHSCQVDANAIDALGEALVGTGKPLIVSAGVFGATLAYPGRTVTEEDALPENSVFPRLSEQKALAFGARGVRASAVRLPPTIYGDGDQGFIPVFITLARATKKSAYIGDGANRWPTVHRLDAARLYRLILESKTAHGPLHAIAEEGVPFKSIAEVISRRAGVPLVSLASGEETTAHFAGFAGRFASIDAPASSAITRATLGWNPTEPGLIATLDREPYFAPENAANRTTF